MKTSNKILLGIATFLPTILAILSVIALVFFVSAMENAGLYGADDSFALWMPMVWIIVATLVLISLITYIYYFVDVIRKKNISDNERLIWVLTFLFANGIGQMVYYFMRVLPEESVVSSEI